MEKKKAVIHKSYVDSAPLPLGQPLPMESAAVFATAANPPEGLCAELSGRQASLPQQLGDHLSAKAFATVGIHDKASARVVHMGVR